MYTIRLAQLENANFDRGCTLAAAKIGHLSISSGLNGHIKNVPHDELMHAVFYFFFHVIKLIIYIKSRLLQFWSFNFTPMHYNSYHIDIQLRAHVTSFKMFTQ